MRALLLDFASHKEHFCLILASHKEHFHLIFTSPKELFCLIFTAFFEALLLDVKSGLERRVPL